MPATSLPKSPRNLLLTVHIAATVSALGADLVLMLMGVAGLEGAAPLAVYPAAYLIGVWLLAPLALLSLGTGLLLGLLTPWGLFGYWWVTVKLAITVGLSAAVLFVLVPRLGAAADAALDGTATVNRLPLAIAPAAASIMLIAALALAVFKPGWRLRARTADHAPVRAS